MISGSEAARKDLPAMMNMEVYDFATGEPVQFGCDLHDAMISFARGSSPELYDSNRYYATTKVFTSWWADTMARKYGDRLSVFAVSPGASSSTNASRNMTVIKKFNFARVMPLLDPSLGMDQPVEISAGRYVDVLNSPKW